MRHLQCIVCHYPIYIINLCQIIIVLLEVTVIILVEFAVGLTAIIAGFGFKHTYVVSVLLSIAGAMVTAYLM